MVFIEYYDESVIHYAPHRT